MICVICDKEFKQCRCDFKKPLKAKRGYTHEVYTTIPRSYAEMLATIEKSFPVSIRDSNAQCIFKITVHGIKTTLPPAATDCGVTSEPDAARKG